MEWVKVTVSVVGQGTDDDPFTVPLPYFRGALFDHARGVATCEVPYEDAPLLEEDDASWGERLTARIGIDGVTYAPRLQRNVRPVTEDVAAE